MKRSSRAFSHAAIADGHAAVVGFCDAATMADGPVPPVMMIHPPEVEAGETFEVTSLPTVGMPSSPASRKPLPRTGIRRGANSDKKGCRLRTQIRLRARSIRALPNKLQANI